MQDIRTSFDGYHLRVWREDEEDITLSWSDLMRIKNEVCGEHMTLIEVYPAMHRVVNDAPIRHFWAVPHDSVEDMSSRYLSSGTL